MIIEEKKDKRLKELILEFLDETGDSPTKKAISLEGNGDFEEIYEPEKYPRNDIELLKDQLLVLQTEVLRQRETIKGDHNREEIAKLGEKIEKQANRIEHLEQHQHQKISGKESL